MRTLFFVVVALLSFTAASGQKVKPALNLEKGKTYQQGFSVENIIDQQVGDKNVEMTVNVDMLLSYLVKEVGEDFYELEACFKKIKGNSLSVKFNIEFNSEESASAVSAMVNKPFRIRLNKTGHVEEISGLEQAFNSLEEKIAQKPHLNNHFLMDQLYQSLGENAIQDNINTVTSIFPGRAVSVGESWTGVKQMEIPVIANVKNTYTLKENNSDHYLISCQGAIEKGKDDEFLEIDRMQVRYNVEGPVISEIKVDKKSGWVLSANVSNEIKGKVEIKDTPQTPGGMIFPVNTKTRITVRNEK